MRYDIAQKTFHTRKVSERLLKEAHTRTMSSATGTMHYGISCFRILNILILLIALST